MKYTNINYKVIGLFVAFFLSSKLYAQNFSSVKDKLPCPVFEENPEFVDLYWKAWELAYSHVKEQEGIPQSPYMDEAFWDNTIWIWDTEFMVLFCKYAPGVFPGIESLNNFYEPILNDTPMSLRIQHPDNPPFYAWVESDYYKMTGDDKHIANLLNQDQFLKRYYDWFEALRPGTQLSFEHVDIKLEKTTLGYKWGGIQSGMDNTPRGRNQKDQILWVDAVAQQALSALYIARLAESAGNEKVSKRFKEEYELKKKLINDYYWDEADGFYYDISEDGESFFKVRTPASFWVMLAEIPNQDQAERMMQYASDPLEFGGPFPWVSVSRSDQDFNGEYGDYWRGGIWIPTAYMATKALEKYHYYEVADENAYNLIKHMSKTYQSYSPNTIWECYNPSKPEPVQRVYGDRLEVVRPDFCGWSALAPISMLIENVLGFHIIDASTKTIEWRKYREGVHGIRNLRFGDIVTDIIAYDKYIEVRSNSEFKLKINQVEYPIHAGTQKIEL